MWNWRTIRRARETKLLAVSKVRTERLHFSVWNLCEIPVLFYKQQKKLLISLHTPNWPRTKEGSEFNNKNYLIIVDYFSNFFSMDCLHYPTSKKVTERLRAHFVRYEIPATGNSFENWRQKILIANLISRWIHKYWSRTPCDNSFNSHLL